MSLQHPFLCQLHVLASLSLSLASELRLLPSQFNRFIEDTYIMLEIGQLIREGLGLSKPLDFKIQGRNTSRIF